MPKINLDYSKVKEKGPDNKIYTHNVLSKGDYNSFNPTALGLGNISQDGTYVQAIACFYDLEGFTSFSNQVDSHLVVPEFLKRFVDWLFQSLRESFKASESNEKVKIWGSLPFYTKFLGDGILFLWDTDYSTGIHGMSNTINLLHKICLRYQSEFLPEIRKHVSKPPSKLRCGVARGQIISIGDGNDYVGSCINIASRLQKLSKLTFAISRRGLDLHNVSGHKYWQNFILKKVELRGIGDEELIYIRKVEFDELSSKERKIFKDP
ncbi:MAG TPA: hypothetical protein VJ842_02050 [Pyrinomonadaceae bacterium]|nr:hypothetical protein [Pyrinomonadaceae bacterium]